MRLTSLDSVGDLEVGDTRHLVFEAQIEPGLRAQPNSEIERCRWFRAAQLQNKNIKDSVLAWAGAFLGAWLEA